MQSGSSSDPAQAPAVAAVPARGWQRAVGFLTSVLLLASAAAHATAGWWQFTPAFDAAQLDPGARGGLHVGWLFGSVAMAVFGLQAGCAAWTGRLAGAVPLRLTGAAYVLLGAGAFLLRDRNPHFLGFVVLGSLLLAATAGRAPAAV